MGLVFEPTEAKAKTCPGLSEALKCYFMVFDVSGSLCNVSYIGWCL